MAISARKFDSSEYNGNVPENESTIFIIRTLKIQIGCENLALPDRRIQTRSFGKKMKKKKGEKKKSEEAVVCSRSFQEPGIRIAKFGTYIPHKKIN